MHRLGKGLGVQASHPDGVVPDDRGRQNRRYRDYGVVVCRPECRASGELAEPLNGVTAGDRPRGRGELPELVEQFMETNDSLLLAASARPLSGPTKRFERCAKAL